MYSNSKKHEGFTLIEVIISVAVMAVFITGVHGIVTFAMKNNKDAEIKQEAAMYGQQIFEDFKSSQVTKTINENELKLSNGSSELFDLIGDTTTSGAVTYRNNSFIDLGNRYKADITVKANSSGIGTVLNKEIEQDAHIGYIFNVALAKSDDEITIKDLDGGQPKTVVHDETNSIPLLIYIGKYMSNDGIKKKVTIKNEKGEEILNKTFTINSDTNEQNLLINMDFAGYENISLQDDDIKIKVYNQDLGDTHIISKEKPKNLYLSLEQYGSGKIDLYDKTSSEDLYDINVMITRDGKTVFEGSSSQNMQVIKN